MMKYIFDYMCLTVARNLVISQYFDYTDGQCTRSNILIKLLRFLFSQNYMIFVPTFGS